MFTEPLVSEAWKDARGAVVRVRNRGQTLQALSLNDPTPRPDYIAYMGQLDVAVAKCNAARSTPGIVQHVRTELNNPTLDVDGILTTAGNACAALRDWINNNFLKAGNPEAWLVYSYSSSGAQTTLMFTSAQLAGFRTNVDTLLATTS